MQFSRLGILSPEAYESRLQSAFAEVSAAKDALPPIDVSGDVFFSRLNLAQSLLDEDTLGSAPNLSYDGGVEKPGARAAMIKATAAVLSAFEAISSPAQESEVVGASQEEIRTAREEWDMHRTTNPKANYGGQFHDWLKYQFIEVPMLWMRIEILRAIDAMNASKTEKAIKHVKGALTHGIGFASYTDGLPGESTTAQSGESPISEEPILPLPDVSGHPVARENSDSSIFDLQSERRAIGPGFGASDTEK